MAKYGFTGVDLDWEYPVAEDRGGKEDDTKNLVLLVKEMRESFGTTYDMSAALALDYWYLRGFDAKGMEDSLDFFGFMAYDLHGFWDADVLTLGSVVRGQADIREVANDTLPLWFANLDPSKINFGLAYYGRGYTLADSSCKTLGCSFSGPSKAGGCTNYAGVMSLREIEAKIASDGLTPVLLAESMMKQITFDDQWIGYYDAETIALKKAWADTECFGGTMVWSVDFSLRGSGDTLPVTTDGTCGASHGGTVCGDWPTGNCCSASGYCGGTDTYCGNGCQSGDCLIGGQTTDGTCGAAHHGSFCGDFINGACCSSSGYCGSTEAHCGAGCQSGCPTIDGTCGANYSYSTCDGWSGGSCCSSGGLCGDGDDFCGAGCQSDDTGGSGGSKTAYIADTIYVTPSPTVHCFPPCTLVFPPSILPEPTTILLPPLTTTITVDTITTVTVITPAAVTTTVMSFWPLVVPSGTSSVFHLTSSLQPPNTVISITGAGTKTIVYPGYTGVEQSTPFYVSGAATPTASDSTGVAPIFYTLPTTVVTSDTVTQTFSEDQVTYLHTLTTPTVITTTLAPAPRGSSTTTPVVVTIPVAPGGFYWSPWPLPGPTPFPIPLPSVQLPPAPSAPCFKVGIFSINCPPNKGNPTTHFSRGTPSPTCQSSCGTINKGDDNNSATTTKTSTSQTSCASETHTACYTREGAALCTTYEGCSCTTSTVTDYWVSCSGGGDDHCTTTSSAAVTGCFVTATATTAGDYCATDLSVSPDDEQVDLYDPTESTSTATSTLPAATPTASWSVAIYAARDCRGDYFSLGGFNPTVFEQCLVLRDGSLPELPRDTDGIFCRWFTDGGFVHAKCDEDALLIRPASWQVRGGTCTAYSSNQCDSSVLQSRKYSPQGCQNWESDDVDIWSAVECGAYAKVQ